jgi:hypothetical protein
MTTKASRCIKRKQHSQPSKREVPGFEELLDRFERTISVLEEAKVLLKLFARGFICFIFARFQPN